ncbi:endonuclease/exonuclease/phosphatase family protein [Ulvibacterium marinum]|uniref:Endonuclease/exonuclease/phosphatase family protein n=1 Tax=Ulvibacterium marinum TaxID=2419782 RepID=A0A3B0CDB9_9FLAO|nr:endonuclease/exonuclease/phosphatase family protein [Ulvibacterium marinum]RKN82504.1 endonuclease/exonuclease/phosphatase family protein [Ulvibacterium marinum]
MKKKIAIVLVQVLIFSSFSLAQKNTPINTMSFNIRYDNPEDGKQNWHHRKENVVRMINFYDLDIIGMQEVLINQLDYLKQHLGQYQTVGVGREDGKDKGEFSPIFYRKDRFEELKSGTFWLSETPEKVSKGWDASLERIATWALVKDKITGKKFVIMNTHFDHIGKQARIESAKLLKQKSKVLAKDLPLILTGDFNLVPESEAIKTLTAQDGKNTLVNSSNVATLSYGPDWTTCGFDNRPFPERKVIDYIFVKQYKKVIRYAVFSEMLNDIFLSDHCPVFAQIEL